MKSVTVAQTLGFPITVCDFQSMKSLMEMNSLFLKLFCYMNWYDETYCFFETIAQRFKNYKLIKDGSEYFFDLDLV